MGQCCARRRLLAQRDESLVDESVWTTPMTKAQRRAAVSTRSLDDNVLEGIAEDEYQPPERRAAALAELSRRR